MSKVPDEQLRYTRELPGAQRGSPTYYDNETVDHLVGIVLELGAQLWVTRDRLARVEEQLAQRGSLSTEQLDNGRPSPELEARLKEQRLAMIEQVYARLFVRSGGDRIDRKHLTAL
jgi:hypothetical protein